LAGPIFLSTSFWSIVLAHRTSHKPKHGRHFSSHCLIFLERIKDCLIKSRIPRNRGFLSLPFFFFFFFNSEPCACKVCHLSHVPSPFTLGIFQIRFCFYAWAGQDHSLPPYTSLIAGMTDACYHT
jgi:hypothetical protein